MTELEEELEGRLDDGRRSRELASMVEELEGVSASGRRDRVLLEEALAASEGEVVGLTAQVRLQASGTQTRHTSSAKTGEMDARVWAV